jgi:ribosomal-protein-alanine N-acetyltransferase
MDAIVETERFIIREFLSGEENLYLELFADERLTPYLPKRNTEQNREIFKAMLADYAIGAKLGKWAIFGLDDDLIGFIMLKKSTEDDLKAELGYNIHYQYWNKGIATAACQAVIKYGFEQQQLTEITATIVPANIASEKVLLKAGLHKTAEVFRDGEELFTYAIFPQGKP